MTKGPLAKVGRLHQTDEVWESTVRRMRAWITPRNQAPYRPYIMLTTAQNGNIVGSEIFEHVPSLNQVLNTLAKMMCHPILGGGRKRRPAIIHMDGEQLAEALAPKLQEVGIRCMYQHTLHDVDQALLSMEQFMSKSEPMPGLLDSPGVTPYLVKGVFEAAAHFYDEAPWRWVDDARPIEVRYPPDSRPRYAVVMGHGGQTYGLAAYDTTDELRELYSGTPPDQLIGRVEWTALLFSEPMEMPFEDLDNTEKYGWPVAGELAYPLLIRITRSGQFARPAKSELLWLEAALLAIPAFVHDHMRTDQDFLRPAEFTLSVNVADIEETIHLRYPVPGFEIPSEEEWVSAEEEEKAQAGAARERNAVLLRIFEQRLTHAGLSAKTVQRHLDNARLFADIYMAGEGGSLEAPRPADQADTLDVDDFLAEWFVYKAPRASVSTMTATISSLKKLYTCLKETDQMEVEEADAILELLREDRDYYIHIAKDHKEGRL